MPKTPIAASEPMPGRVVRVALPDKVLHDLESMQKIKASILGKLGCPRCHSGFDLRFGNARMHAIDDALNIAEQFQGVVIVHG